MNRPLILAMVFLMIIFNGIAFDVFKQNKHGSLNEKAVKEERESFGKKEAGHVNSQDRSSKHNSHK